MKKSALILLMIIVTLSSLFTFSACDKDKGTANGKTVTDLLGREVTVPEKINLKLFAKHPFSSFGKKIIIV